VRRELFFWAVSAPFLRSQSTAFSRSPATSSSSRAFLQSIIGAPLISRSSLMSAGLAFGAKAAAETEIGRKNMREGCARRATPRFTMRVTERMRSSRWSLRLGRARLLCTLHQGNGEDGLVVHQGALEADGDDSLATGGPERERDGQRLVAPHRARLSRRLVPRLHSRIE
jgi:hypothetical protein